MKKAIKTFIILICMLNFSISIGYSSEPNLNLSFVPKHKNQKFELTIIQVNWEDSTSNKPHSFNVEEKINFSLFTYKSYVFLFKYKEYVKILFVEASSNVKFMSAIVTIDISNNICCSQLEWLPNNQYRQKKCEKLSECFKERMIFINEILTKHQTIIAE